MPRSRKRLFSKFEELDVSQSEGCSVMCVIKCMRVARREQLLSQRIIWMKATVYRECICSRKGM